MEQVHIALAGLLAVLGAMTLLWLVSLRIDDVSIVDPFWAPGFLLVTGVYAWQAPAVGPRGWLVLALVGLWAVRLGAHLVRRNLGHGEDPRYAAMRASHGPRFAWLSLFTVFWLQAVILWVVSAPLFAVVVDPGNPGPWDVAGAAVFLAGIVIEGVADLQLERFKRDPDSRGRVLDRGLWRYSRHPNYFGNAVLWWGAYLMAVGAGAAWTVVGPILMTYLLLRVSGVTLLERDLRRRKPGYEAYVARTSAFFPWPPRSPEDAERPGERTRAPDRVERSGTGGPDA